jgi:N-methylhydantoinase A
MTSPRRVGIDTGGTFTDAVTQDGSGYRVHKCPTTPDEPSKAVLAALAELAPPFGTAESERATNRANRANRINRTGRALCDDGGDRDVHLVHGTTHATNALLTGRLGRVALITTAGFADVLAVGRQEREDLYCLAPQLRRPKQDPRAVVEVQERLDASGKVLQKLEKEEVQRVVDAVAKLAGGKGARQGAGTSSAGAARIDAIAVCFLHSYLNPIHEKRIARAMRKLRIPVVCSAELAAEHREFERFTTAWADASLAPVVGPAMHKLQSEVQRRWSKKSQVRIMRSDGGTASAQSAADEPVHLALSGPAGGLCAARTLAEARGDQAILTLDMGGTSTDVALLGEGELPLAPMQLGGLTLLSRGLPIHSVGTGGGSLAQWDAGGALTVGPASAGAVPGPVCYGRGGTHATVTDAHLVIGRLHPERFLGGEFHLDLDGATAAIQRLGKHGGLSVQQTAEAVLQIASADMERALRRVSLAEGFDPRSLTLYAFGGAGGLHAAWVAERLGMEKVVMPPMAGAFSAVGLLAAPPRRTLVQTVLQELPSTSQRRAFFAPMEERLRRELQADGIPPRGIKARKILELRSQGQAAEFPLLEGPHLLKRFHQEHQRRFGYTREDQPVIVVSLRVQADGPAHNPWQPMRMRKHQAKAVEQCKAVLPEGGGACQAAWFVREDLKPGATLQGPAIVAEYSGTTVVPQHWTAQVDRFGALELVRESEASS